MVYIYSVGFSLFLLLFDFREVWIRKKSRYSSMVGSIDSMCFWCGLIMFSGMIISVIINMVNINVIC